ncbi:hypothetical protein [Flavobacterium sp. UBA7663]|uniref:hypothetical protein n=1 Tax=Flavobacterium sp. UBA7663 TaxID=1946557 RepID=UPI0025BCF012|nr:hypothetical protein [Flavobacterium sp. UBA7663]
MKLFEKIDIKFINESNIPVKDLIVSITVLANKKNNYSLGSLKTDSDGKIIVFRSTIENKIQELKQLYIMDYSSDIDDCKDWIIIKIESKIELETRSKNMEKYYPENAKMLLELSKECSNKSYKPIEIEHEIEDEIEIIVQNN